MRDELCPGYLGEDGEDGGGCVGGDGGGRD